MIGTTDTFVTKLFPPDDALLRRSAVLGILKEHIERTEQELEKAFSRIGRAAYKTFTTGVTESKDLYVSAERLETRCNTLKELDTHLRQITPCMCGSKQEP